MDHLGRLVIMDTAQAGIVPQGSSFRRLGSFCNFELEGIPRIFHVLQTLFGKHAAPQFCLPDRSVRDLWKWADEEIV